MKEFKTWRDIKKWAEEHKYHRIAKRLQLNNDCWWSSGEFGRSQKYLCDTLRFCDSEAERKQVAEQLENELKDDIVLDILEEGKA